MKKDCWPGITGGWGGVRQPLEDSYIQAAIYDGDPTTRTLKGSEGKLMITEAGFSSTTGSYKVGYWNHTADITVGARTYSNDYGMHGLIPMRFEDDLGVAVARAQTQLSFEATYELTYRAVLLPWLAIQPSFQFIQNPGADPTIKDARVGLLRFEVTL